MNECVNLYDPIIQLSPSQYDEFCRHLQTHVNFNLDIFKNKWLCNHIKQLCHTIFCKEIKKILALLNDSHKGIAALDIPENHSFNKSANAVYGAAVVLGIFNNIGKSNFDSFNLTPFTLHTASHSSGQLLESTENTPDTKLGFHNDGLLSSGNLEIPKNILLYNLYIGYRSPGKFKWIPTALWKEADNFGKAARSDNIKINIALTPYFNLNEKGKMTKTEFDCMEIPISSLDKLGQKRFFLNGKILNDKNPPEYIKFVQKIKESLEFNAVNISIEQKERRAFYFKNTMGFHARDIFEDPIEGIDLTRVFLRSVDVNAEIYPSNILV